MPRNAERGRGALLRLPRLLNLHHLELFYHVARNGGISRAVRAIPYGVQQPAVSSQILQLEQHLGAKLFNRTPFRLTSEGGELFAFISPFFDGLSSMENRLRSGVPLLRLAATEPMLRDHLPAVLRELRARHPKLQIALRSGYQSQLQDWLIDREIDLVVTALESRPPKGISSRPLLSLPLALLVPKRLRLRSASELWDRPRLDEPLISLPPTEVISRNFQRGLSDRRRTWTPSIVASSIDTVARYVAEGYGIGLAMVDGVATPRVKVLPLPDFPPVKIAVLWAGRPSPIVESTTEVISAYVRRRWPAFQPS
jgi:DNA-binding transcriptional LysR family regulator